MLCLAEYIWLDGAVPTKGLRSKSKILDLDGAPSLEQFPDWGFDGSSTGQAEGHFSDCILKPVNFVNDPIRGEGNYLVLCEVYNVDGTPHVTNSHGLASNKSIPCSRVLDRLSGLPKVTQHRKARIIVALVPVGLRVVRL